MINELVGNKTKERLSKRRQQENKASKIFQKTNMCVSGGKKRVAFVENF